MEKGFYTHRYASDVRVMVICVSNEGEDITYREYPNGELKTIKATDFNDNYKCDNNIHIPFERDCHSIKLKRLIEHFNDSPLPYMGDLNEDVLDVLHSTSEALARCEELQDNIAFIKSIIDTMEDSDDVATATLAHNLKGFIND